MSTDRKVADNYDVTLCQNRDEDATGIFSTPSVTMKSERTPMSAGVGSNKDGRISPSSVTSTEEKQRPMKENARHNPHEIRNKTPVHFPELRTPLNASPINQNDSITWSTSNNVSVSSPPPDVCPLEMTFSCLNTTGDSSCTVSREQEEGDAVPNIEEEPGHTPVSTSHDDEETQEERLAREQEESEALARHLMAEEAMASYAMSSQYLENNAEAFSTEDLAALQQAMQEEDPNADEFQEVDSAADSSADLSYETMLQLGERLGDVKQERWAMNAHEHIRKLPLVTYQPCMAEGKNENDSSVKCLVCQCAYENGDVLRCLPCKHLFHAECVDQWLSNKDVCPYCRQSILPA